MSFCSDYVYLFDSNPNSSIRLESDATTSDGSDGSSCPHVGNDPPMKRLRLRGDWSDTGPNARPECEDSGTSENSFVQRMSGYLTRWIEESLRSTRRQRRRNPRTAILSQEEASERSIARDENPDVLTVGECEKLPSVDNRQNRQETGTTGETDVTSESKSAVFEGLGQDRAETSRTSDREDCEREETWCHPCGSCKKCVKACEHVRDPINDPSGEGSALNATQRDDTNVKTTSTEVDDRTFHSESSTKRTRGKNKRTDSAAIENEKTRSGTTGSGLPIAGTSTSLTSLACRKNIKNDQVEGDGLRDNSDMPSVWETPMETLEDLQTEESGSEKQDSGSATQDSGIEILESDFRNRGSITSGTRDSESIVQEPETNGLQSSRTRTQNPGGSPSTLRSQEPDVGDSSESDDDDSNTRRNAAASTIQNFFRYRHKKDSTLTQCDVPVFSNARQMYKGHRNARTMVGH